MGVFPEECSAELTEKDTNILIGHITGLLLLFSLYPQTHTHTHENNVQSRRRTKKHEEEEEDNEVEEARNSITIELKWEPLALLIPLLS